MAERINRIYVRDGTTTYYSGRWGGAQVWLDGLTHPSAVLKIYRQFSGSFEDLQHGLDGATLVDEDNKGLVIGIWLDEYVSYDKVKSFIGNNGVNTPEGYFLSGYFEDLIIQSCPIMRTCYLKLATRVWEGWRVKLAHIDFAEKPDVITNFDEIPDLSNNGPSNCQVTEAEAYRRCVTAFFLSEGFPLTSVTTIEQGRPPEPLAPREVRIEDIQKEWIDFAKEYSVPNTQEEIDERRIRVEEAQIDRELVYETICKAYASLLEEAS